MDESIPSIGSEMNGFHPTPQKYTFHMVKNSNFVRIWDMLSFFDHFSLQFKINFFKLKCDLITYCWNDYASVNTILKKKNSVCRSR